jgi:hypothetical protein
MYDLLTSSVLFLVLVPGVLVTLPPGGGITAAVVHAVVFYVVQRYVAAYVPWWGIWIIAGIAVLLKVFGGSSSTPSQSTSSFSGGRR